MSTFLRDLAIAKFPRFGITYYIQLDGEPEIQGGSVRATLKFWDGKTAPPKHLTDRTVKMPIWKWGDFMDVIEAEIFSERRHIVAVELCKRRPDDEYGTLRVQLDKQATLDALNREAHNEANYLQEVDGTAPTGPSKPAAAQACGPAPTMSGSERGQPGAGGAQSAPEGGSGHASAFAEGPSVPLEQGTPPPADPGLPPDCPRCGQPAAFFDSKWVHCGEVVQ